MKALKSPSGTRMLQEIILNFFDAASQALRNAGKNPQFLGAETGAVAVLHTWGQTLYYHRFMMHVLPKGFYKIRYYGILATANINTKRQQAIALSEKTIWMPVLEMKKHSA